MTRAREDDLSLQLSNLRELRDTALGQLDVDTLLEELLDLVRELLHADTAAVLLMDRSGQQLEARVARGIEEEVRQGVRIALGAGFAGTIAATRGPVRLDHVDHTTVANPLLWERGIKVMLGVPLLSGDRLLGVLHVGRLVERAFDDDDVEALEAAAVRIAAAIETRQSAVERAAATTLERSLLPTRLPDCDGLEFATRYVPAADLGVGGDWYDLFTLPSGCLWVVAGDVAGHGLESAVVMGRIRSALRAYTMLDAPPEEVLRLVDLKVSHFEIGTIATVVCAVSEPPYDSLVLASAGHPPPVLAVPGEAPRLVELRSAPPLGAALGTRAVPHHVEFPRGAAAVFYTDGLIERRGESIDVGLERLRQAVTPGHPERVAADVMRSLVGTSTTPDDVALVIVRRTPTSEGDPHS